MHPNSLVQNGELFPTTSKACRVVLPWCTDCTFVTGRRKGWALAMMVLVIFWFAVDESAKLFLIAAAPPPHRWGGAGLMHEVASAAADSRYCGR